MGCAYTEKITIFLKLETVIFYVYFNVFLRLTVILHENAVKNAQINRITLILQ